MNDKAIANLIAILLPAINGLFVGYFCWNILWVLVPSFFISMLAKDYAIANTSEDTGSVKWSNGFTGVVIGAITYFIMCET